MKTIGLIGGMSWESSAHYYRLLNEAVKVRLGGLHRVALLGTRYVMEEDFYRRRLAERHGLDVRVPGPADRQEVNRVIFEELCLGRVEPRSKARYVGIMKAMVAEGAEAVIAGCTEITMLVQQPDLAVPLFDTTELHALAAVDRALGPEEL